MKSAEEKQEAKARALRKLRFCSLTEGSALERMVASLEVWSATMAFWPIIKLKIIIKIIKR